MTAIKLFEKPKNDIINIFDEIFDDSLLNWDLNLVNNTKIPTYDIVENDNEYILHLMLPGFKKDNLSINVNDNMLIVEGERKVDEKLKFNYKGSFYGQFKKSFTLPKDVLSDKLNASYQNGVLSISIPKNEKLKLNKTIEIK